MDAPVWAAAPELLLDDPSPLIGRQIGSYRIAEEIGRGGMGVVYAAEDQRLGRMVAIKALPPEYTRDPARRARLTREARAAAALSHPAIATIYTLEETADGLYIVGELVRGRTLREELGDGPLPPSRLVPTLLDIAGALDAAHRIGIVHRDLKPENVMRRDDGQIKVLDFGLARWEPSPDAPSMTRLTQDGVAFGTPGYMAPEQLGGGAVDARADLFSFGVVAWELASGEHPFGADPALALSNMAAIMEGRAALPGKALAGLDAIVIRCLRAAPADRYGSAAALLGGSATAHGSDGARLARAADAGHGGLVVVAVPSDVSGDCRRGHTCAGLVDSARDGSALWPLDLPWRARRGDDRGDAPAEPAVHVTGTLLAAGGTSRPAVSVDRRG